MKSAFKFNRKKINVILVTIFTITILIICIVFRQQVVRTVLFFPNYNPFSSPELVQDISISQIDSFIKRQPESAVSILVRVELTMDTGQKRKCIIYIPAHYSNAKTYNSVIFLHGSPGSEIDWIEAGKAPDTLDKLINNGLIHPLIGVFPDGNGGSNRDTQFINAADGSENNETFIATTVPEFIKQHFNVQDSSDTWAIAGNSSGGFGAINIGLKHQDTFGYIISLSGYGRVEKNDQSNELIKNSKSVLKDNSPLLYASHLKQKNTKIYLSVGNDDRLKDDNEKLNSLLLKTGYDVTYEPDEGIHNWGFWSQKITSGLLWMDQHQNNK